MTSKRRRRFSLEYELEAVRMALGGGEPQNEVAQDLGISPDRIRAPG